MRKTIRKTHSFNRLIYHTEAVILRLSALHVKTRHNHGKHENHKRKTSRIPQSIRVASKMRPLLKPPEHATTRCTIARRMPALPKSAPMQPTQKINTPTAQKRLPLPSIKTETKFDFWQRTNLAGSELASLAKVFMVHKKLSFSATRFRLNGKTRGAVG